MTGSSKNASAAEWQVANLLYPLYRALAREFELEAPPCLELESSIDVPSKEDGETVRLWFKDLDDRIQVHQLRQFLQTTTEGTEESLRALLRHHLHKAEHSDADRDKIDFMLVQFFSQSVPANLEDSAADLEYVAIKLEPLLETVEATAPDWLSPLEDLANKAKACGTLSALFSSGILEKGRKIKVGCGQNYFVPAALVAFTRFNFLLRRVFFHLMHQDINTILDGLRQLESNGVATLDCRAAQFSEEESTTQLRMICQSWKVMFQAEYSSGQPMKMLAELRGVVDAAIKQTAGQSAPLAHAAAAGAEAPEFEVSGGNEPTPDVSDES